MGTILAILFGVLFIASIKFGNRFWIITFVLLSKCWFPLVLVLVAYLMLGTTSQGLDLVQDVNDADLGVKTFGLLAVTWFWGFNSWMISRTILDLVGTQKLINRKTQVALFISTWIPRIIGLLPFVFLLVVLLTIPDQTNGLLLMLVILETLYYILYILARRKGHLKSKYFFVHRRYMDMISLYTFPIYRWSGKIVNGWFNKLFGREDVKVPSLQIRKYSFREHLKRSFGGIQTLYSLLHLVFFIAVCIWPIFFSDLLGPVPLIFAAFACYLMLGTIIIYVRKVTHMPILLLLVVAALLFSGINDNNEVAVISAEVEDNRSSMEQYFEDWLEERISTPHDTVHVVLGAAEGGGIRSAYWTYAVLRQLNEDYPKINEQLFAMSTVSGGSVGAGIYLSELKHGFSENLLNVPLINDDNLSPMIAGLFYRELPQSIIPYPIKALDRSRISDRAWEEYWRKGHKGNPELWSRPFETLWEDSKIPLLLVNSVHVESGNNVVFSPMKFDSTTLNSVDLMSMMKSNLRMSTVLGISSRFPYFQPPALVNYDTGEPWGHLADGGYYENSGVATTYQLYLKLREIANSFVDEQKVAAVNFTILMISNGRHPVDNPAALMPELSAPMKTLLNSWFTKGFSYSAIANKSMPFVGENDRYSEIALYRKGVPLPVGWYLSKRSIQELNRQASTLMENEGYSTFVARLKSFGM